MRIETDKIYCGDSLQVLQTLPENAVDCCVTSPPTMPCGTMAQTADRTGSNAGGICFPYYGGIP